MTQKRLQSPKILEPLCFYTLVAATTLPEVSFQITVHRVRPAEPAAPTVVQMALITRALAEYLGDTCELAM